jgi:16S rRNA (cytosine1402-N4)-methyltransferase
MIRGGGHMDNQDKPYKRRVRYKGKYPKAYKEKYKELNPDKYSDTISRVIEKGSTPAGMHIPIMVQEILEVLQIKPGEIGLDATLGYGGHTAEMLKRLEGKGHIYALDIDPIELPKTTARLKREGFGKDILTTKLINFSNIDLVLEEKLQFDFVLADLGVSSMQIDNPERGFSYKTDGPLDLRMDPESGISAAFRLMQLSQIEFTSMLIENADEPYAEKISEAITSAKKKGVYIDTTSKLRKIISDTLQFIPIDTRKKDIKKSCQRTFQALRIEVNKEFESIHSFLEKLPDILAPGGRAVILSFHSGEDRLVKKSFKRYFKEGIYKEISSKITRPTEEECRINNRARSTKLRWAIRA